MVVPRCRLRTVRWGLWALSLAILARPSALAAPIRSQPPKQGRAPTAERPQEVLDAIQRFQAGKLDEALKMLGDATKKYPHLPPGRVMMANLYLTDNRVAEARAHLEKALLETPDDPEPYVAFGDLAIREHRWADADAQYLLAGERLKAFKGDAKRKKHLQDRHVSGVAGVAEGREQWERAAQWLTSLAAQQPENPNPRRRLGGVLFHQGKIEEAYQQFAAASKLDNNESPAAMNVAGLYQTTGKWDEAKTWLERAAKDLPDDPRPLMALSRWHLQIGDLDAADRAVQAAEKLSATSLEVRVLRGIVARFRGDLPTAEKYLASAHEEASSNLLARNNLALTWADMDDQDKWQRALELAAENSRRDPRNPELSSTLGWVYYRLGMFEDAGRALQQANANSNQRISRDTAYYLARALSKQGDPKNARLMLQSAIDAKGPFAYLQQAKRWQQQLQSDPANN